jgi:hypothetical protein
MEKLLRWLGIKLLVRSCVRRASDYRDDRKVYEVVNRGAIYVALIGQKPGVAYSSRGKRLIVLIGECIQFMVGRTVLRTPGSCFKNDGVMQVRPGPGQSWCWMLQIGRE